MQKMNERRWWGHFAVDNGQNIRWHCGNSHLLLSRLPQEFRVRWVVMTGPRQDIGEVEYPAKKVDPSALKNEARFAHGGQDILSVSLIPVLPTRPVVGRPDCPLFVLPGDEATIFLEHPLWLQLRSDAHRDPLLEVPSERVSDTWFGSSLTSGELCYGSKISCELTPMPPTQRASHVLTRIMIRNRAQTKLHIERINLPAPHLSLYFSNEHMFFTETIKFDHLEGGEFAHVDLLRPDISGSEVIELIAKPRFQAERIGVVRAFSSWFS